MKIVSDKEFHKLFKEGQPEDVKGAVLRKQFICSEVRAVNDETREIDFVISTESADRLGDVIRAKGWELENYRNNPVVLFAHDSRSLPVGKAVSVEVKGKKLISRTKFASVDQNPLAQNLFRLYQEGYMRATSVGFRPLEVELLEDDEGRFVGLDFIRHELLEYSLVPVPANPEALVAAKSANIDMRPLLTYARDILSHWSEYKSSGLHLPRRTVEQLYKAAERAENRGRNVTLPFGEQVRLLRHNLKAAEGQNAMKTKDQDQLIALDYATAHKDGTPCDAKDAAWSEDEELAGLKESGQSDLYARCFAHADVEVGEKQLPDTRDAYHLLHHRTTGDNAVVLAGVMEAAAELPILGLTDQQNQAIKEHLGAHYAEFEEEAPWDADPENWAKYVEACAAVLEDGSEKGEAELLCEELFDRDTMAKLFIEDGGEGEGEGDDDGDGEEEEDTSPPAAAATGKSAEGDDGEDEGADDGEDEGADDGEEEDDGDDADPNKGIGGEEEEDDEPGIALREIAPLFLDALDDTIENDGLSGLSRKDIRTLLNIQESVEDAMAELGLNTDNRDDDGDGEEEDDGDGVDKDTDGEEVDLSQYSQEEIEEAVKHVMPTALRDMLSGGSSQ